MGLVRAKRLTALRHGAACVFHLTSQTMQDNEHPTCRSGGTCHGMPSMHMDVWRHMQCVNCTGLCAGRFQQRSSSVHTLHVLRIAALDFAESLGSKWRSRMLSGRLNSRQAGSTATYDAGLLCHTPMLVFGGRTRSNRCRAGCKLEVEEQHGQ